MLSINTASYNFSYSDSPAEKVFTIINDGDAPAGPPTVDLTGSSAYTAADNTCTAPLAGGGSCTVEAMYTGTGTSEQSAQLSVAADSDHPPVEGSVRDFRVVELRDTTQRILMKPVS